MSKPKSQKVFAPGDDCVVTADCGVRNDDDSSVPSVELRGARVKVAGANSTYTHADTGETMIGVTHDNGALSAVPAAALHNNTRNGPIKVGYSRRFANAWREIFDK